MPLRVAINATPLLAPRTGIGNYIAELGAALDERDVDVHSFYGFRWQHAPPRSMGSPVRTELVRRVRDHVKPFVPFARQLRMLQQRVAFGRGLRRHRIDIYHEPNYVPIRYDVPVVITVHDLSWLRFPDAHPPDRIGWLNRGLPRAIERAAHILVDSEFVRQEVVQTFGVATDRVHVAHLGVSEDFRPRTAQETASTLQRAALSHGSYVLTIGTIEPRKNLQHVLHAYARLPVSVQESFPLVVGGARGWGSADLEHELDLLTRRGNVRFLGAVAHEDLVNLYAGAALFVFPSLYEGFGLPPLEAMACGAPVLASNRGSLPEVIGDAGEMLDPANPETTAHLMEGLLGAPAQRHDLARRGIVRAARFTWTACAQQTAAVYHRVAASL